MNKPRLNDRQSGFTIVELMIATTILSVILLLVSSMMIGIGNLFYKATNQSRIQDNVRSISDEITQQLKFGGQENFNTGSSTVSVNGTSITLHAICIGANRYSYVLGYQIGTDNTPTHTQIRHVLWRDATPSVGCDPVNLSTVSSGGTELIAPNSRLTNFSIGPTSPYQVTIGVAFGLDEVMNNPHATNAYCKGGKDSRYCATASLSTIAVKRL